MDERHSFLLKCYGLIVAAFFVAVMFSIDWSSPALVTWNTTQVQIKVNGHDITAMGTGKIQKSFTAFTGVLGDTSGMMSYYAGSLAVLPQEVLDRIKREHPDCRRCNTPGHNEIIKTAIPTFLIGATPEVHKQIRAVASRAKGEKEWVSFRLTGEEIRITKHLYSDGWMEDDKRAKYYVVDKLEVSSTQ